MKKLLLYSFLTLLASVGTAFASGVRQSTMHISAVVLPAARLEVQSATALTVGVTMYPNAQALVWTAAGSCGIPDNPKVISSSGIHPLIFSPEEVLGKDRVCLATSDGILHTSARLPSNDG